MKIKEGFILREVAGSYVVVAVGEASKSFKGVIKLNNSGAILWKELEKGVSALDSLTKALLNEYNIDEETAKKDVSAFLDQLMKAKIVE